MLMYRIYVYRIYYILCTVYIYIYIYIYMKKCIYEEMYKYIHRFY